MEHFAGLDVSVKETSVGIVDESFEKPKWQASLKHC